MRIPAAGFALRTIRSGLFVLACFLLSLAVGPDVSGAAARTSGSLSQALTHSLTAATKAGSTRITVQFFSGATTGRVVQDSSLHSGEQTVAIGKERASVIVVGGVAYFSGNTQGLTSYFKVPTPLVPTLTDHWVSVPSTDPAFQTVSGSVPLSSALANVTPSGALRAGKRSRVDQQWVKSISGEAPGGGGLLTLFVTADKRSLPVEAVETSRVGGSVRGEIVTFGRWGEQLHLASPTGVIPISTLEAASSAAG